MSEETYMELHGTYAKSRMSPEPLRPVVVGQLEGSQEMVFTSLDDAIAEVKALLQNMIDDETPQAQIHMRVERMTQTEIDQLGDFEGY